MSIIQRASSEADLLRVLDLHQTCHRAGYVDMELLSTSLRLALTNPHLDRRNTVLLEMNGELVAFGLLWSGRYLGMLVDPRYRGALESTLLDWAERRARTSSVRRLIVLGRDDDRVIARACWARGYSVDADELRMTRSLDQPLPDFAVPACFSVRALDGAAELDGWLDLYTEAFGLRPEKLRYWRAMRADADHQPALDLVAIDADGRLAGFCYGSIPQAEAATGPTIIGRTEPVAVRRDVQGRGLGRALVAANLALLQSHGAQVAMLTTEAENVDAHRFYQSLGYQVAYRARWYGRDLQPCDCSEKGQG